MSFLSRIRGAVEAPRRAFRIVGNPAFWRAPKRIKRNAAGLVKPWRCPLCRMRTRQALVVDGRLGMPVRHTCKACGTVFAANRGYIQDRSGQMRVVRPGGRLAYHLKSWLRGK